jgi:gamma-glutamyltranspeptidase/glutathione hydrolase
MKAFIFQLCIGLGFWILIAGSVLSSYAVSQKSDRPALLKPAAGTSGMVSSGHPIATEAGLEILKNGGNAFDAAVAVAAVLNVVEPMMSGMGGYGTILIYDAKKGEVRFLNSSGRIPAGVDSDAFRAPTPGYRENRTGPKAVSTPGNVRAWEAMSKSYGLLNWRELFGPAIKAASEGFILDDRTSRMIRSAYQDFPPNGKLIYGSGGQAFAAGDRLVQKDLANSLRLIAEKGAGVLYGGELGKAIDDEMRKAGGFLVMADLVNDKAEWWPPIHINYRGFEVYTASPPATAFPSLIRLGMMSVFDVKALGHNSLEMLHRFCEVTKHAFWCRLRYAGDPGVNPPPLDKLLSAEYWKEAVGRIDMKKAKPFEYPKGGEKELSHTTHFVVADAQGNIVSATQTLGNAFGSRIMPPGTGIWLNNSLSFCTFEPKGNPMDAHAGRRKLSGDCPTIIFREGKPWAALGTPGGHTIGQTVPQMVMCLIDFRMNIQEVLAAPKVSFIEPDRIAVEEKVGKEVIAGLEARGHIVNVIRGGGLTNAHGLTIEYGKDGKPMRFWGASDPRGQGLAKGY